MPNYNRVILMGNLTRDPELRYTPSGQAVADIRIAINRRARNTDGERRDSATFVDVTAWGRQAEVINEYFAKGRPIFLEGRLRLDQWTSQDGQRRSKLRVVLDNFEFITPRGDGHAPSGPPPGERPAQPAARTTPPGAPTPPPPSPQPASQAQEDSGRSDAPFDDDDVPF